MIYTRDDKRDDTLIVTRSIIQLYPDGQSKILIESGNCPVWLDEDQRFLYCEYVPSTLNSQTRIMLYNLESGTKSFIRQGVWDHSPTISPDKKHMIFYEGHTFYLSRIDGERIKIMRQMGRYTYQPFWLK